MLINFQKLNENLITNFRGGEKSTVLRMFKDDNNRIMLGKLEADASIGLHIHDTNSEIIYILQGSGKVLYDGQFEELFVGSCHYCPVGHAHSLINDGQNDLFSSR